VALDEDAERAGLLEWQPHLKEVTFFVRSPTDLNYNCVAFAANDTTQIWSPAVGVGGKLLGGYYWPPNAPKLPSVAATETAFEGHGFVRTSLDDTEVEVGVEKVAIFGYDAMGLVTHAARQCSSGLWASKMGDKADIEHSLHDIAGGIFGEVRSIMRKDSEAAQEPKGLLRRLMVVTRMRES
jgi:hypothetical protein